MSTTTQDPVEVALPEYCDRCPARATVQVVLRSGGELTFCGHHTQRYETMLLMRDSIIMDIS